MMVATPRYSVPLAETVPGNGPIEGQRRGQAPRDKSGTIRFWAGNVLGTASLFIILIMCLFIGG